MKRKSFKSLDAFCHWIRKLIAKGKLQQELEKINVYNVNKKSFS